MKRSVLTGIAFVALFVSLTSCEFLFGKKDNPIVNAPHDIKGQWKLDTISFVGKDTNKISFASALALFDAKNLDSINTFLHFKNDSTVLTIEGKDTTANSYIFDATSNNLTMGKDSSKQSMQLNMLDSNHISLQTKDSILFSLTR
jgi:hypothetical protein